MKNIIMVLILIFVSLNAFAYCKAGDKCPSAGGGKPGEHPGLAAGVGATAISGVLAAPFGATAAISSMAITGGFSLFTAALTNNDMKMYANFRNKAAKLAKKKKDALPNRDLKSGGYELKYGTCKDATKSIDIVKADELYSKLKGTESEIVSSWEGIHKGENAFFVVDEGFSDPLLAFYNNILLSFDETGKSIICSGQIKPSTHNKEITLYCASDTGGFCSKTYSFKE